MTNEFGPANASLVKRSMFEAVRRGIQAIRRERLAFESRAKGLRDDGGEDYVTTADLAAQSTIVKVLREDFPTYGIVGEELGLAQASTHPDDLWFTVDPLDGTNAFRRRQSAGFGPMVSLVRGDRVIAAFVGDAMTEEIFGCKPGSPNVWRSARDVGAEKLHGGLRPRLAGQYVLIRDNPWEYSPFAQDLCLRPARRATLFGGMETANGSIGLSFARLWKGEVGAHLLRPGKQTPWDLLPVVCINERLGFVHLRVSEDALVPYTPRVEKQTYRVDFETLVVHERHVAELTAWWETPVTG